jgi:predicted lipoprotein with Yx(FWY)xxD motif
MAVIASLLLLAAGTVYVSDNSQPAGVTASKGADGTLLTGPSGTPLYTFDGNTGFDRDCQAECLQAWPPLVAPADARPVGEWAPRRREDGIVQWAYKGSLVYAYAADRGALTATGDGLGGRWHALRYAGSVPQIAVPAAAQVVRSGARFRLADHRGFALYTFARDGAAPACQAECLKVWPPLLAPALARPMGRWAPFDRPDGIRQWTYRGRLVYRFSQDQLPGETRGDGAGGAWKTIEVTARDAPVTAAGETR